MVNAGRCSRNVGNNSKSLFHETTSSLNSGSYQVTDYTTRDECIGSKREPQQNHTALQLRSSCRSLSTTVFSKNKLVTTNEALNHPTSANRHKKKLLTLPILRRRLPSNLFEEEAKEFQETTALNSPPVLYETDKFHAVYRGNPKCYASSYLTPEIVYGKEFWLSSRYASLCKELDIDGHDVMATTSTSLETFGEYSRSETEAWESDIESRSNYDGHTCIFPDTVQTVAWKKELLTIPMFSQHSRAVATLESILNLLTFESSEAQRSQLGSQSVYNPCTHQENPLPRANEHLRVMENDVHLFGAVEQDQNQSAIDCTCCIHPDIQRSPSWPSLLGMNTWICQTLFEPEEFGGLDRDKRPESSLPNHINNNNLAFAQHKSESTRLSRTTTSKIESLFGWTGHLKMQQNESSHEHHSHLNQMLTKGYENVQIHNEKSLIWANSMSNQYLFNQSPSTSFPKSVMQQLHCLITRVNGLSFLKQNCFGSLSSDYTLSKRKRSKSQPQGGHCAFAEKPSCYMWQRYYKEQGKSFSCFLDEYFIGLRFTSYKLWSNKASYEDVDREGLRRTMEMMGGIYKVFPEWVMLLFLLFRIIWIKKQFQDDTSQFVTILELRQIYQTCFFDPLNLESAKILKLVCVHYSFCKFKRCVIKQDSSQLIKPDISLLSQADMGYSEMLHCTRLIIGLLELQRFLMENLIPCQLKWLDYACYSLLVSKEKLLETLHHNPEIWHRLDSVQRGQIKARKMLCYGNPSDDAEFEYKVSHYTIQNLDTSLCIVKKMDETTISNREECFYLGPTVGVGGEGHVRMCFPASALTQYSSNDGNLRWNELWRASSESNEFLPHKPLFAMKITAKAAREEAIKTVYSKLQKLSHKNVVQIFGLYEDKENYFLLTELLEGPELLTYFLSNPLKTKVLSEDNCKGLFFQILSAIRFLHEHQIIHRDIKLENFVCADQSKMSSFVDHYIFDADALWNEDFRYVPRIVVIDFGLACTTDKSYISCPNGTPLYMAPELLLAGQFVPFMYQEKVDIWAAGIILYQLLSGQIPFDTAGPLQAIKKLATIPSKSSCLFSNELHETVERFHITRYLEVGNTINSNERFNFSVPHENVNYMGFAGHTIQSNSYKAFNGNFFQSIETDVYQMNQICLTGKEWISISDDAKDLLYKLLTPNANFRLSASQALHHKWFRGAAD